MLTKEYRIPMPLTTTEVLQILHLSHILLTNFSITWFQYKIGQLYMIAKHSNEQSSKGEGVEVCANHPYEDAKYGAGQFTEKRIHLSRFVSIHCVSLGNVVNFFCILLLLTWFKPASPVDQINDSPNFLHHRKSLELLSIHHNWIYSINLQSDTIFKLLSSLNWIHSVPFYQSLLSTFKPAMKIIVEPVRMYSELYAFLKFNDFMIL